MNNNDDYNCMDAKTIDTIRRHGFVMEELDEYHEMAYYHRMSFFDYFFKPIRYQIYNPEQIKNEIRYIQALLDDNILPDFISLNISNALLKIFRAL